MGRAVPGVALAAVGSLARGDSARSATTTSCSCTSPARSPGPSWTPSRGGCGTRYGTPVQDRPLGAHRRPVPAGRCRRPVSGGRAAGYRPPRGRRGGCQRGPLHGCPRLAGQARRRLPQLVDAVQARHTRMGDAAHLLEPDLKEARGGLRDMTVLRALTAAGSPTGRMAPSTPPTRGCSTSGTPCTSSPDAAATGSAGRTTTGSRLCSATPTPTTCSRTCPPPHGSSPMPSTEPCAGPPSRSGPGPFVSVPGDPLSPRSGTGCSCTTGRRSSAPVCRRALTPPSCCERRSSPRATASRSPRPP